MLTEATTYGVTCDVCSTRLDLGSADMGVELNPRGIRQWADRQGWVSVVTAGQDVCTSCVASEVGKRYLTRLTQTATGPHIAPSDDPANEPAEVVPSGDEGQPGSEERQNSDEPFPGEPRETTPDSGEDEPEEGQRDYARLEGAGAR